jgi:deoxyadenosine/deoxycytidine kinase
VVGERGYSGVMTKRTVYPYMRKQNHSSGIRIEIMADSMRVGKTTAVKVIAEGCRERGLSVHESYEDWQHNPYLEKSYDDPAHNFLHCQKWFIQRKWEQIREGGKQAVFIQDVSPEMDYCYAETNRRLGRMSDEHFAMYHDFFHSLDWTAAPAPTLLVYLQVGDDELIRRAMDSRRKFEDVDPAYFLMMKRVNREWLKEAERASSYHVLTVDTDVFDFAHEIEQKKRLQNLIFTHIDLL